MGGRVSGRVSCLAAGQGKRPYGLGKEAETDAQRTESRLASAFRVLLKNGVVDRTPLLGFFGLFLGSGHGQVPCVVELRVRTVMHLVRGRDFNRVGLGVS